MNNKREDMLNEFMNYFISTVYYKQNKKKFKSKNIYDKLCFVSDKVRKEGYKVGHMYREEPMKQIPDSGWRFLAGNEDDEYMNNPNAHHIVHVLTVSELDPDVIPYLESKVGSSYIRIDDDNFELDDDEKEIYITK